MSSKRLSKIIEASRAKRDAMQTVVLDLATLTQKRQPPINQQAIQLFRFHAAQVFPRLWPILEGCYPIDYLAQADDIQMSFFHEGLEFALQYHTIMGRWVIYGAPGSSRWRVLRDPAHAEDDLLDFLDIAVTASGKLRVVHGYR